MLNSQTLSMDMFKDIFNFNCGKCETSTKFRSGFSGMGDDVFVFCDKCGRFTYFSGYEPIFQKMVDTYGLSEKLNEALPDALNPCHCGGRFQSRAYRRCAGCRESVSWEDLQSQNTRKVPRNFQPMLQTAFPGWKTWCSFCGSREKPLILVDNETKTYACNKCR